MNVRFTFAPPGESTVLQELSDPPKMGTQSRRKIGRPVRPSMPGERSRRLGVVIPASLKERLEASADSNGRGQSQEAAYRLQRSFEDDDLVERILAAVRGGQ